MNLTVKSRWTAFAIHLALSLAVLVLLLTIVFYFWFPRDLIFAGGIDGLKILIGVDIILGPVLTLMVYKQGKKGLKSDLILISAVQIGCLLGGLWLVYNERPLLQVLADDGVHLLAASDFKFYQINPTELPGRSPKWVLMDIPEDHAQLGSIKFTSEFVDEKPFVFRDDLYQPMLAQDKARYESRIKFIQQAMDEEFILSLGERHGDSCDWVPLHSKHNFGFACLTYQAGIISLSERQFW